MAAGIRVRRRDDFVLLVRAASRRRRRGLVAADGADAGAGHRRGHGAPRCCATACAWSRDGCSSPRPSPSTIDGIEVVVNVFDAIGWSGEPRYAERNYLDAAWVNPAALEGVDIVPEVSAWLSGSRAARAG